MRKRSRKKTIRKITVPDLSGLTRSQAQFTLSSLGLIYSESTTNTSNLSLSNTIYSQETSQGSTAVFGDSIPFVYYNYVAPSPGITYGPCEAYGTGTSVGTGTQCSGTYTEAYTDYSYNTRKKVYSDGVWDGTTYSTTGCVATTSRTVTSTSQVNGQCGYTTPPVITYGACEAYGSGTNVGSGTQCSGTYSETYIDYSYATRKKVYSDGVWDGTTYSTTGCVATTSRTVTSTSQVNGQCGYTTPPVITYGACEAYGTGTSVGTGTQCSGTYTEAYTDYSYNTRKKVYSDGVWDGTTYSTTGCVATTSRTVTSTSQVNGQCGYTTPPVITYGACEAYGSGTNVGSGTQCSGNYYQSYTDYTYNTRKKIYSDGVWDGSSYSTSGCGTTTERTVNSSSQVDGQCGYTAPVSITYGACEAYGGAIANLGSGSYCSGTTTVYYTNYRYNAQRKIYVNGSWDGSSYTTSGCSTVDGQSITSSGQVEGSCGYTNPITYGACQAYGEAVGSSPVGSGSYCSGTSTIGYQTWPYNARRTILVNGSWDGSSYDYSCGTINQQVVVSNQLIDGSCGYTYVPPQPTNSWYCTTSINGGGVGNCDYTMPGYDNSASGSGYSRQCTFGTSYPACQSTNPSPVCSTYKYQCKSYDVTNSASNNYSTCFYTGECAANNNSDGSRSTCCAGYA